MYGVFIGVSYVLCMYRGFRMYGVFIGGFVLWCIYRGFRIMVYL